MGLVSLQDLRRLGMWLGTGWNDPLWDAAKCCDGNNDGEVNISDVQEIGANWLRIPCAFLMQYSPYPNGPWIHYDYVFLPEHSNPLSAAPNLVTEHLIDDDLSQMYWRVALVDAPLYYISQLEQHPDPKGLGRPTFRIFIDGLTRSCEIFRDDMLYPYTVLEVVGEPGYDLIWTDPAPQLGVTHKYYYRQSQPERKTMPVTPLSRPVEATWHSSD